MTATDQFIDESIDRMQQIIPSKYNLDPAVLSNMEATKRAGAFGLHNGKLELDVAEEERKKSGQKAKELRVSDR